MSFFVAYERRLRTGGTWFVFWYSHGNKWTPRPQLLKQPPQDLVDALYALPESSSLKWGVPPDVSLFCRQQMELGNATRPGWCRPSAFLAVFFPETFSAAFYNGIPLQEAMEIAFHAGTGDRLVIQPDVEIDDTHRFVFWRGPYG